MSNKIPIMMEKSKDFDPPTPLMTPVLLMAFNRPENTQIVFDQIRKATPPRLYLAVDGPKKGNLDEADKVQKVREIVEAVDWQCQVKTLFRSENLGCKHAVSGAITWFFQQEEHGIILEDDCLPDLSFFWYCEELLNKYKDDSRIFHIDGTNFTGSVIPFKEDYDFSKYALIWGWATWRRAWKHYNFDLDELTFLEDSKYLRTLFNNKGVGDYWIKCLKLVRECKLDTWDYQWFYTIWINNGLCIRPRINLIKNIGFGPDATHTKKTNKLFKSMVAYKISIPLRHPSAIIQNINRDKLCSTIRFGLNKRKIFENAVKNFIKKSTSSLGKK